MIPTWFALFHHFHLLMLYADSSLSLRFSALFQNFCLAGDFHLNRLPMHIYYFLFKLTLLVLSFFVSLTRLLATLQQKN